MCGRYALTPDRETVLTEFDAQPVGDLDHLRVTERYNIAPTQPVAVVVPGERGRRLTAMRWGIIPQWMKSEDGGKPPAGWINARAETAAEKPAFRGAFKYRRCLVPASGFYEWAKRDGSKQPYYIQAADDRLLAFAGLWETWTPPDGSELDTVTILTTTPNAMMAELHDRMPVVLEPEAHDAWMTTPPEDATTLRRRLGPAAEGTLSKTPVSRRVNRPKHDDPACLEPEGGHAVGVSGGCVRPKAMGIEPRPAPVDSEPALRPCEAPACESSPDQRIDRYAPPLGPRPIQHRAGVAPLLLTLRG